MGIGVIHRLGKSRLIVYVMGRRSALYEEVARITHV